MKQNKTLPAKVFPPIKVSTLKLSASWLPEPSFLFADDRKNREPKIGLPLYGPRSLGTARHPREVRIGFVGVGEDIERARELYRRFAGGIDGDEQHAPFPGCSPSQGFRCHLRVDDAPFELVTQRELDDLTRLKRMGDRFEAGLALWTEKLRLLSQRDSRPDYVAVCIPDEVRRVSGHAVYFARGRPKRRRDLRQALKAAAMQFRLPTQLLMGHTLRRDPDDGLDHESVVAWNLLTGLYFKAGGLPWGPADMPAATCFVGITFFRPPEDSAQLRTSVVQAFDENGDGIILRGHKFYWDDLKQGRSPHLPADESSRLIEMVLNRYKAERKHLPRRVVIHKSSGFDNAEKEGFTQALRCVDQYDFVHLKPASDVRLFRTGRYPPLRGTAFTIGAEHYLYTTGYLDPIARYPHGHVPSPLRVADHVGDAPDSEILREVMTLTKLNWNSASQSFLLPVTLRFSQLVGEILREVPDNEQPEPAYKYYM